MGGSRLLTFQTTAPEGPTVFVVPSLIGRWHIVDLQPETSLVAALSEAGFRVYVLDWGHPRDWDRHVTWDDLVQRVGRFTRSVLRHADVETTAVLGYSVGGTLATIATALKPHRVNALVNLAGPIDFAEAGIAKHLTDERWFDARALAAAGNIAATQMWAGTVALRPTAHWSRWLSPLSRGLSKETVADLFRLEDWVNAAVPFPAKAYERYIAELYQKNTLIKGRHTVNRHSVDLGAITCPVLAVTCDNDLVCPPAASTALLDHVGGACTDHLSVPGGHVGGVIGDHAPERLHGPLLAWLQTHVEER